MTSRHETALPFFRRLLGAGLAVLVLGLALAAASPELHRHLHDGLAVADDDCAVVLFAHGVTLAVAIVAALFFAVAWRELPALVGAEILLASPRYLRQPERGPPVS